MPALQFHVPSDLANSEQSFRSMTRSQVVHEAQPAKRGASKHIGIAFSALSMKWYTRRLGTLGVQEMPRWMPVSIELQQDEAVSMGCLAL